MRVSVVIPCYNSLRYLPETLDSVLDQQLPEAVDTMEVVLVDDGGDDDLAAWAATRAEDRVRVVRQDNAGVSAARNLGIASASGEVIAFCDSDDLWCPNTVADLLAALSQDPGVGLSYGWDDVIDARGELTGATYRGEWEGWIWEQLVTGNPISASGVMVRREVFDDVGMFAVNRDRFPVDVEDWELWIRIARRWRVGLAQSVVCRRRLHGSNSTTDVDSLEAAYAHLFDVVFADPDPAHAALRPVAEAHAAIVLGWQSLNDREDPGRALAHLSRAATISPPVARTAEYWRLKVAATALRATGPRGYRVMRSTNATLRRLRSRISR